MDRAEQVMHIRIQVIIEADQGAAPTHFEEVACFKRGPLSPETLGLRLDEAKQMLAGVQQVMTTQQVEEYVEQQRQCPHCQQPLACKGRHQIGLRTLFGKLTLSSPRLYTCSCQLHQKRSWSPVAALFSERSPPELLYQEVRWASLLSYGVTIRLLGDLLPMEHQLSTSTISRHVHQVAERLEGELGDEQPSFIEGCPDQWYKLPELAAPLVVSLDGGYVHAPWERIFAVHVRGAFLCSKYAIPGMIKHGKGGSVINVSSVAGLVGLQNMAAYSAAKGAIISLTRSMAADFAQYNIRVNCIAPGTAMTPWVNVDRKRYA